MAKVDLKALTIRELLDYEVMTRIVCTKFENESRLDGFKDKDLYERFENFNKKYESIFQELKKRVEDVK